MDFTEKQLVELFLKGGGAHRFHALNQRCHDWSPGDFSKKNHTNILVTTEFALPSGRRCDLVVHNKNKRYMWICEFKIVAETNAIIQLSQYAAEAFRMYNPSLSFGALGRCIAAQFFKPETLFFARRMGIQCLQISPINFQSCNINVLNSVDGKDLSWEKAY